MSSGDSAFANSERAWANSREASAAQYLAVFKKAAKGSVVWRRAGRQYLRLMADAREIRARASR
jgi:hypothetical protein